MGNKMCAGRAKPEELEKLKKDYELEAPPAKMTEPAKKAKGGCSPVKCACACCCCLCLLYLVAVIAVAYLAITKIVNIQQDWLQPVKDDAGNLWTPANVTFQEWWPGCDGGNKTVSTFATCAPPCYNATLPDAMNTYNNNHAFELVNFPSRAGSDGQETLNLTGFWLPADDATAPIVVITHGMSGANVAMRVQVPAFLLRKLGYSVLLPNLRDHGLSPKSKHPDKHSWGWEYHNDILGAWDWAVLKVGDSTKVGLMGNSMGGFASAIAAGMETKVPGLWIDGAIFDPYKDLLVDNIGSWAEFITYPAWQIAEKVSGLKLRHRFPGNTIPARAGNALKVAMVVNKQDHLVQGAKTRYIDLFDANPTAAVLKESFWPDGKCNGEAHCVSSIQWADAYSEKLDTFWGCALKGTCVAQPAAATAGNISARL